jgi:hypothetical protein
MKGQNLLATVPVSVHLGGWRMRHDIDKEDN